MEVVRISHGAQRHKDHNNATMDEYRDASIT